MKAVIQRVKRAGLYSDGEWHSEIGKGMLVLVGVTQTDTDATAQRLAGKILRLRIFEDENGKTNKSVSDVGGEIMVVSNFTLYGNLKGTNRPDFTKAAPPEQAERLYEKVIESISQVAAVATGVFRTHMEIEMRADGPCTYIYEEQ